jgi:UTP--glucose-1-phosphate uridylyltransferase
MPVCSYIEGKRYDIGNKLDFLKTNVEFALRRKEFAKPFYFT